MVDLAGILSPKNVESRNFLTFSMPSNAQIEDKGELNSWLEAMMFIFEDVKWLLSLDVIPFWNQVIYDESWPLCFDSFLQKAPRLYDLENISDSCKVPLSKIARLLLLAVKRMSINSEDQNNCFSKEKFGELIYESYLFDAAKLLDISSIYYNEEDNNLCTVIEEIYENIFKCQPNYFGDMSHAVNSMMDTITNIEERLVATTNVIQNGKDETITIISGKEAQDILMFLYDMSKTLQIFINAFPRCSQVFFKSLVVGKLASFSEHSLMSLLTLIEIDRKKFKYVCSEIKKSFIKFVSTIITYGFVKRDQSTIGEDEDLSAEFVSSIDSIGQCPQFLSGYYALGNVDSDFQAIEKLQLLDNASLEYAKNMLGAEAIETDSNKVRKELLDILPGQNAAFIDKCIETYGPKVDVIMNNIMEGNIIDESIVAPVEKKPLDIPNKEVLRDDKHVALLKATWFEDDDDEQTYDLYDDEYDDTYDSQNVGANDVDDWEEFTARRKFTIPAALRQIGDVSSESDEDENKEGGIDGEKGENADQNKDSATAPAGNRYDNNRGGNRGRGGRGRGARGRGGRGRGGGNPPGNSNSNQDNVNQANGRGGPRGGPRGNPRGGPRGGRGNSRGGHHNHRRLADKKRSQGMMPF